MEKKAADSLNAIIAAAMHARSKFFEFCLLRFGIPAFDYLDSHPASAPSLSHPSVSGATQSDVFPSLSSFLFIFLFLFRQERAGRKRKEERER
jgi:hypothetical protein